jgi:hypothetical protein
MAAGLIHTKALGDTADDLVYTPVVPCRIVDSRNAGGVFAPGETRNYHAYLSSGSFASQGSAASNFGIPANPCAVALNSRSSAGAGTDSLRHGLQRQPGGPPTLNLRTGAAGGQWRVRPAVSAQLVDFVSCSGMDLIIDIAGYRAGGTAALCGHPTDGDGQQDRADVEKKLPFNDAACTNVDQTCVSALPAEPVHLERRVPLYGADRHALQRFPGQP